MTKVQRLQLFGSSGKGSVAFLSSHSARLHDASPALSTAAMRRAVGLPVFNNEVKSPCACPVCTQRGVRINVLLHLPRCPRSPAFHSAHGILAQAIRRVCEAAGARPSQLRGGKPGSSELIGLRSDATRPIISDVT